MYAVMLIIFSSVKIHGLRTKQTKLLEGYIIFKLLCLVSLLVAASMVTINEATIIAAIEVHGLLFFLNADINENF